LQAFLLLAVSGKLTRRPDLDRALLVARAGDQLVVTKLDRLGRSLDHRVAKVAAEAVSWNYTTVLNIAFLLLAAALLVLFFRSGGAPMLKMMGGSPDGHEHGGAVAS
jgi:hypothetical protein